MRNRPEGIDVSNRQGQFDWAGWNGYIEFAMAKATEGIDFIDEQFARNWEMMKVIAVKRFAYHYAHPSESDPAEQAQFFVEHVRQHGLEHGDNFVLDLETNDDSMTPSQVSFWAFTFCREVNRLAPGHRVMVYTYESFANEGYCSMLGEWHLWIAQYDAPGPTMPVGPWHTWVMWQDVGSGVDRDVFNGDLAQLDKFVTSTG
jgi:lysozyme